jgi:hypothetical protein
MLASDLVPDERPDDLPPLRASIAAALTAWAIVASLLYLAVRELGLQLIP